MVTAGAAWVMPTARACRPALLSAAAIAMVVVIAAVIAGASDVALPTVHVWLALAALAVAASTPHDPAATLLAALPAGRGRRMLHRGAIGTLTALGAWVLAGWSAGELGSLPVSDAMIGGSVPALLALVAVAVVGGLWFGPWAACTPLALVAGGHIVEGSPRFADLLQLWWTHPWAVLAAAVSGIAVHHRAGPW